MRLQHFVKTLVRRLGYDLHHYSLQYSPAAQLQFLLTRLGVDLVLDVGAHQGQYASQLRGHGYRGRLVSFEPLSFAHASLTRRARGDPLWEVAPRGAIGQDLGETTLHVSGHSLSSSILPMLPSHERSLPQSRYVAEEVVPIAPLDQAAAPFLSSAKTILLKIDTQGYEDRVLAGGPQVLARCAAVQVEMSLVPLYAGQLLWRELMARIVDHGFELAAVFPGYVDEQSGRTLQLDGFFVRSPKG